MSTDDTDNENTAKTTLRTAIMRFAAGATEAQADQMLDEILAGWPMLNGSLETLAKLAPVVSPNYLKTGAALFWMHATVLAQESRNGCELSLAAGVRAAARCGVTAELLDQLRVLVKPAKKETGH